MHLPSFKLFKTSHLDVSILKNEWFVFLLKPWIFPNGPTFLEHEGKNDLNLKIKKLHKEKSKIKSYTKIYGMNGSQQWT